MLSVLCLGAMAWSHPYLALAYGGLLGVAWLAFLVFVPATARTRFDGAPPAA